MRKTLSLLPALGLLLVATPAAAQTAASANRLTDETSTSAPHALRVDQGWNTDWALLLSLNNILVNNNVFSSPVAGSIGANYFLSQDTALRLGVNLSRTHNPAQVTKVVTTTGADSITTYQVTNPTGFTEAYGVNLRGDYLKRLSNAPVAPYVGAGAQVGWSWTRQNYVDDKTVVEQRTELDNNTSSFDLALRGILGAEWRVHPNFALYADYNFTVGLYSKSRVRNRTTIENSVGGLTSTTQTTTERDVDSFLNISTGLSQGASLGLSIFF